MEHVLEVSNLKKDFGGFVLSDVSFSLDKGYVLGFIGPNGAGKTTTIKLIMNLLQKDGGEIKIFNLDHIRHEVQVKKRIGFVYDENHFYEELTAAETKRYVAPFYSGWDDQVFNRYMKEFSLPANQKLKEMSKGMKMKFSLALALSHRAELLIMDEPTSGLDPLFRSELLEILRFLMADENLSILFSTHITSDLDKIADYIVMIDQGKTVLQGTKEEVIESFRIVKGQRSLAHTELRSKLIGLKESEYGFEALTREGEAICRQYKDSVVCERPTLEDIMLFTLRRGKDV